MLAWFLGRLLDRLGYDEFDILGISWGGGLAQQVAFQHPRRCRRLVLVSTATGSLMVPASPLSCSRWSPPAGIATPTTPRSIAAQLYGGRLRDEPELARTLLHEHSRVGSRCGYLLQLLAGAGWTSLPGLPFVRQPTLILAGSDDPIIPLVERAHHGPTPSRRQAARLRRRPPRTAHPGARTGAGSHRLPARLTTIGVPHDHDHPRACRAGAVTMALTLDFTGSMLRPPG